MTLNERRALVQERVQSIALLDPSVKITLGGQEYTLHFDLRAAKALQSELEINMLKGYDLRGIVEDMDKLLIFLQIGLRKYHGDVSMDILEQIIPLPMLDYVFTKMVEAVRVFYPNMDGIPKQEECDDYVGDPTLQMTTG